MCWLWSDVLICSTVSFRHLFDCLSKQKPSSVSLSLTFPQRRIHVMTVRLHTDNAFHRQQPVYLYVLLPYHQPCVFSGCLMLLQTFNSCCVAMPLGSSSGTKFWWAWGHCVVCWCTASNVNKAPSQEAICSFWGMISDGSSFDIFEITAVLFVRALAPSLVEVKVTRALSSCVQMYKNAEIQKKLAHLEIINLKKLEIYYVTFSGGIFGSLWEKWQTHPE